MWKICITATLDDIPGEIGVALVNGDLLSKVAFLKRSGCESLELMTLGNLSRNHCRLVRKVLDDAVITVSALSSGAVRFSTGISLFESFLRKDGRGEKAFCKLLDSAIDLSAPVLTVGGFRGRCNGEISLKEYLKSIVTEMAKEASRHGIAIAIEAINRYEVDYLHTAAETLSFALSTKCDNVGILLDTFHMNIEESSMEKAFELCIQSGRLLHIHAADSNRSLPGLGHIDFHLLCNILNRLGYERAVSGELEKGAIDENQAVKDFCDYFRGLQKSR